MAGGEAGSLIVRIIGDPTGLTAGMATAKSQVAGFAASTGVAGGKVKTFGATVAKVALGAAAVTGVLGVAAVKMAGDFDENMRKVWSLTEASEDTFKGWKRSIQGLTKDVPQSANEMAEAFYWVTSNMPDATDAQRLETLRIAARGATGGVAELADTTSALTQAQNAYREQNPQKYMDVMNKAVERGSITLQDFVSNQGKYVGAAAIANVSVEETSAAMATLTRNAIPADTAAMALNQTMMAFLKPTDAAVEVAEKYGIELTLAALKSKGLAGAMMEVANNVPDEELANIFPNIRALKAVFPLAGIAAEDFAADLVHMQNAAGTTDRMFKRNVGSLSNQWKIMTNAFKRGMEAIGEKILPYVTKAFGKVSEALRGDNETFNKLVSGAKAVGKALIAPLKLLNDMKLLIPIIGAAFAIWLGVKAVAGIMVLVGAIGKVVAVAKGLYAAFAVGGLLGGMQTLFPAMAAKIGLFTAEMNTMASMSGAAATQGGLFAGSLSAIGVAAGVAGGVLAGVGIAAAVLIPVWQHHNAEMKRANAAYETQAKSMYDSAVAASPLVTRFEELNRQLESGTLNAEQTAAAQAELATVNQQIANILPEAVEGFDAQGQAVLRNIDYIHELIRAQLEYQGVTDKEKKKIAPGVTGDTEAVMKHRREVEKNWVEVRNLSDEYAALATKYAQMPGAPEGMEEDARRVGVAWRTSAQAGEDASERFRVTYHDFLYSSKAGMGQFELDQKKARAALDRYWGRPGAVGWEEYREEIQSSSAALQEFANSLNSMAASAAGAGQAITDDMIYALTSLDESIREVGGGALQTYFATALQSAFEGTPEQLGQFTTALATQLQAGDFSAFGTTGVKGADDLILGFVSQMSSVGAQQAWKASQTIPTNVAAALTSSNAQVNQAAWAAFAPIMLTLSGIGDPASEEAKGIITAVQTALQTGNFESTGNEKADQFLVGLAVALGQTDKLSPALKAIKKKMDEATGDGKPKVQKVTLEIDSKAPKKVKEAADEANEALKKLTKGKKVPLNDAEITEANKIIDRANKKMEALTGDPWTVSVNVNPETLEVHVKAVTQSVKRVWDDTTAAGAYFAEEVGRGIASTQTVMHVGLGLTGGSTAAGWKQVIADAKQAQAAVAGFSKEMADLIALTGTRTDVFTGPMAEFLQQMRAEPVNEIVAAIEGVVDGIWRARNATADWNNLTAEQRTEIETTRAVMKQAYMDAQGAVDGATNKVNELNDALTAQQEILAKLQKQQTEAQEKLTALQSARLIGETALDNRMILAGDSIEKMKLALMDARRAAKWDEQLDASSLKIEQLKLAIMDAKKAGDYKTVFDLSSQLKAEQASLDYLTQKEKVSTMVADQQITAAQREADYLAQYNRAVYDAEHHRISIATAAKEQEYSAAALIKATNAAQKQVNTIKSAIKTQEDAIAVTQNALKTWNKQLDKFKEAVRELADFFVKKWQDMVNAMQAAQQEAERAAGEGGTPAQVLPRYQSGGGVPRTMQAIVDKGEWVVPSLAARILGPERLEMLSRGLVPAIAVGAPALTGGGTVINVGTVNLPGVKDTTGFIMEMEAIAKRAERRARVGGVG